MKKTILLVGCSLMVMYSLAQSSTSGPGIGHQRQAGRYLGWAPGNGSVPGSLEIRNDFNEPITMHTNGIPRALIQGGAGGNNAGQMALGNNLPANFNPTSRLHLHQDGQNRIQFTNSLSNANPTVPSGLDGFQVGINNAGVALIRQRENLPMRLFTTNTQRMMIDQGAVIPTPTDGYIMMGDDITGLTPEDRLHIFQTVGDAFTRYDVGAFQGFRIGLLNAGNALIEHLDDNDIIVRNSLERMRVHGNFTNIGLDGLVRIGENNGTTPILQDPTLLVTGSVQSIQPDGDYTIAEFRSKHDVASSAGIKIRGSRNVNGTNCAAHIDLANWDNDEPPGLAGTEFNMSRIGSDMEFAGGQRGNFSIFTNSGTGIPGGTGMHQAVYISGAQNVGIGDENIFNIGAGNLPSQKLDVNGNGRFRTLPTLAFDATGNAAINQVVYVDANGVLYWKDASTLGTVSAADNGLSLDPATSTIAQLGNDYTGTPNPTGDARLLGDREIPMNDNNLVFTGMGVYGKNHVTVGEPAAGINDLAKFDVHTNVYGTAGLFRTTSPNPFPGSNATTAIVANSINNNATQNTNTLFVRAEGVGLANRAIVARSVDGDAQQNYGIRLESANGSTFSVGAEFDVLNSSSPANWGIRTDVIGDPNSIDNIGIEANSTGHLAAGTEAIGGKFCATNADNNVGIYAKASNDAGLFDGNVTCMSGGVFCPSDQNMKTNVQPLTNAMSIINQLNPKTFEFLTASYPSMNLPSGQMMGLIAQEVETVLPGLIKQSNHPSVIDTLGNVITPSVSYKSMKYEGLIPVLLAGMKEQQTVIDSLMDAVETLSDCVNESNLCNTQSNRIGNSNTAGQTVELNNLNAIILDQNLPNPFKENTVITYNIPEEVMEAQLLFYDMNGRIIKQVDITDRGESQLTVYGDNLKNGIYTYSLIADGELIATKKMMKQ